MMNEWLNRLVLLYGVWFACGYVLVAGDWLPPWLEWANSVYLVLGGATALIWYTNRYGKRQALMLFIISGSISYAAEWIGVHTGRWFGSYRFGANFAPLVFGVPLAIPFAWCMLLIIAKALAPRSGGASLWKGMTADAKQSPGAKAFKRQRRRSRRHAFWLPAVWAATFVTAVDLLLDPAAVQKRYWIWREAVPADWNPSLYTVPLSNFICFWITSLLILNVINYLHDEYFEERPQGGAAYPFVPMMLLLTLEALFLTLALRSGLWWAALLNICALLALLTFCRGAQKKT